MRKLFSLCAVMLCCASVITAQTPVVSGQVKDDKGDAIGFATIMVKGTSTATSADQSGNFKIAAAQGSTLVISAAGFQSAQVKVGDGPIQVSLKSGDNLREVVVTALGVKREARSTGYSVATVPTSELTQARVTNPANGLAGKVSGLQINTVNNGVNGDVRVVLRGERSITGNNQALIVIDNVPVSADYLNALNPDDIENISVLKGANAAALYGTDASNGVILVTTKRGGRSKPSITFTHTTTIEKVSFLPAFNTRFGAASTEPDSINPYTGYYGRIPYENQMYGPEYNGQPVALGYVKQLTRPDGTTFDSTNSISYDYKNPVKAFFQTGRTFQNGISYQQGDQNGSFFFSGQFNNTLGTVPKDQANRFSGRVGASKTYGKFSANFSVGYTKYITDVAGVDYAQGRPVYWNVLNTPGEVPIRNFQNLNAPFANENDWYNAYYPNPYWQIENSRQKSTRDDILSSLEMNLKATSWLSFTYRIGATATNYQQKNTIAGVTFSEYEISDPLGAGNAGSSNPNGVRPKLFDQLYERFILQSDFLINMEHKFVHNNLNAKLLLGNSVNKNSYRFLQSGTNELEIPGVYNVSNIVGVASVAEGTQQTGKIGVYGSLQLAWKNFLFLEVTGRNDWVSLLAPQNRSFFYPGVSGSFVFTDAIAAMKNIPWLSFGKLIASYTKAGNVNLAPYSLANTFGQINGFPYSTTGFSLGNGLANPGLTPEFTLSREVGLQLGLLHNRINFQGTYFDETVKAQTVSLQVSSATGYTSTNKNVGNVHNWGYEFDLRLTPLMNLGPVKWNLGANVALYRSKVISIDPTSKSIFIGGYTNGAGVYTDEGQPMRVLKVIDWKRDSLGRVIVDANTGRPSAASAVTNMGTTSPKIILGLNTSFEYKGITLSALAEYRGGAVDYQNIGSAMAFTGASAVTTVSGRQRFVFPNSVILQNGKYVPNTNVAIDNVANGAGFFASTFTTVGTPFVTSADFWKIREVAISYNIPLKNTTIIKKLSVGLVARNLFTFLPKDNPYADPEYNAISSTGQNTSGNAQGISNENLSPPTRIFGGTFSVSF